ncbi:MAG: ATP-binding cassette domain-containing protein [Candidatus Delongbacteria bacterium]|nr:ATP-binding cassette domain-containing protein [Candidatus Delongbacteria bacterium]MBN2833789.1 ATP-binding cassette domain-containing protein [Candidatus Delongbacteria bacterium]
MSNNILEVKDLKVKFPIFAGIFMRRVAEVRAVDGVSFNIKEGETLGLVGESGSGKSTIGKAILNVLKITAPDVEVEGSIKIKKDGKMVELVGMDRKEILPFRKDIQMIFQDPYSSLNPRMTVGNIVKEPMDIHEPTMSNSEKEEKAVWLLEKVGLSGEQINRYPHEFSGGQRQRIGIARSLATNPKLIIADEPVSALDVSIQAQVINLMQDLQQEFNLTFIFIAHDLSVVEHLSNRIAVMYLGNIMEIGDGQDVYRNAKHPYTRSLLSAVPLPDPARKNKQRQILQGDIPSPLRKPSGCGFRTRCPLAKPECAQNVPEFVTVGENHLSACPYSK